MVMVADQRSEVEKLISHIEERKQYRKRSAINLALGALPILIGFVYFNPLLTDVMPQYAWSKYFFIYLINWTAFLLFYVLCFFLPKRTAYNEEVLYRIKHVCFVDVEDISFIEGLSEKERAYFDEIKEVVKSAPYFTYN